MKRKNVIILVLAVLLLIGLLTACGKTVSFKIDFIVDGAVIHTIYTKGNEEIQLPADPEKEGYIFDGWYWDKDTWEKPFTANSLLNAPLSENMSVYAKWIWDGQNDFDTNGYYLVDNDIWFGEYPQTIKANDVTITETTDSRGYYLGSDGYYYAKVTATPYISDYKFSTNATVTSGTVYYFKVEPIKWRILSESGGTALILCESIIANKRYDDSSNNYANSEIRAWLNDEFYNTAFTALQQELIQITNVDNSVYSTGFSSNPYACANTNDKIFLPSNREMVNSAYGFNSEYHAYDTARRRLTSDYSRATGAYMSTDTAYYGNGWWWLRSPIDCDSRYARYIFDDGSADSFNFVYRTLSGVVPALKIRLSTPQPIEENGGKEGETKEPQIFYEDESGFKLEQDDFDKVKAQNQKLSDTAIIRSEKLKWEISKDEPDVDPTTIDVVDENTQNEFEYWSVVKHLKTEYEKYIEEMTLLNSFVEGHEEKIRNIYNCFFSNNSLYIDADVVITENQICTQERRLIATSCFDWKDNTNYTTLEKLQITEYLIFAKLFEIEGGSLTTDISNTLFETKMKIENTKLSGYIQNGYTATILDTAQYLRKSDSTPMSICYAVLLTKCEESRIMYINTDVYYTTGEPEFVDPKTIVSEPLVDNWAELKNMVLQEQANASASAETTVDASQNEVLNMSANVVFQNDKAKLTIFDN